jgi:hypothetical protein
LGTAAGGGPTRISYGPFVMMEDVNFALVEIATAISRPGKERQVIS